MLQKRIKFDDAEVVDFCPETAVVQAYASVFGNVDSYGDRIMPGAYKSTIEGLSGLPMLFDHDPSKVIGRWTVFSEDEKGLRVMGDLTAGHSLAEDVKASLAAGHLDGFSIGYSIPEGGSKMDGDVRELHQINLNEISVVTFPADVHARGALKAADMQRRELERSILGAMRDAGFEMTRSEVVALTSGGFEGLKAMRDSGGSHEATELKASVINAIRNFQE